MLKITVSKVQSMFRFDVPVCVSFHLGKIPVAHVKMKSASVISNHSLSYRIAVRVCNSTSHAKDMCTALCVYYLVHDANGCLQMFSMYMPHVHQHIRIEVIHVSPANSIDVMYFHQQVFWLCVRFTSHQIKSSFSNQFSRMFSNLNFLFSMSADSAA